ncbi:MAG: hypothetical protein R6V44_05260 [Paracoccaceae bacterium]
MVSAGHVARACRSDPATFDAFVQGAPPAFAHLLRPSGAARALDATGGSGEARRDDAARIAHRLGLDPRGHEG